MKDSFILQIASKRGIRGLLRLFQKRSFQAIHSWPVNKFPWTDKGVTFCLSFDCDNPTDAQAIPDLLNLLDQYNIKASFAVCGELVEEYPDVYMGIIEKGHEIINHGYSKHVVGMSDGSVKSTLFYHELSTARIEVEIEKNHECLKRVLGTETKGFRVPHFGTFQNPEHFKLIYEILSRLGYKYDTSATAYSFQKQRLWKNPFSLSEFPLSGYVGAPLSVFDSWGFMKAPNRKMQSKDFFPRLKETFDLCIKIGSPIFYNIYVDPSHVTGFLGFEDCLKYIVNKRQHFWTGTYSQLCGELTDEDNEHFWHPT